MTTAGSLEIRLLGRFAVLRNGLEVPPAAFAGRKVRTLVKVLATRQGRFVSNDLLAEALWPDRLPADPVANLQVLVNRARRAMGDPSSVVTGQGGYLLAAPPVCEVDAELFLAAVAPGRPATWADLREALDRWQGDPLPEEAYDDWASDYRSRLQRAHQQALETAAALAVEEGEPEAAVDLAGRAVTADPLRETAVLALVDALTAAGDPAAALQTYDDYRRALADELGVSPSAAAAAVHARLLRQGTTPDTRTRARPPRAQLLGELTFVGRDAELAAVRTRLAAGRGGGVVVVAGVSGAGKSRLIDEVARHVAVVRARAYLAEQSEPWSLLRTLLRDVLAQDLTRVDALPAPMAAAVGWLLPELDAVTASTDPESRRILVQQATLRLLGGLDAALAVDDLQWCDPRSLEVLEAATNRVPQLPVLVAVRPDELGPEVGAFLDRVRTTARIDLGGLPGEAIDRLVDDPRVADALREHTGRTPMAVAEVLRALAAEGLLTPTTRGRWASVDGAAAGRAVELAREGQHRAVAARVAAQPADDRELLALLAVLARETPGAVLAQAAGADEPDVLGSLGRLHRRGLVRLGDQGWATSHDLVTEVVAASLDPADRVRLHAAVVDALPADDDPVVLAQHLRAAGRSAEAAAAYARAARHALDAAADDEAVAVATQGLDLGPPTSVAAQLHEVRGQARQRRGDIAGARDDLDAALAAHPGGPDHARLLARLALLASGSDDLVRAAQLAELAVVEAGTDATERARALEVASVLDMNLGHEARAAERASEALALYERLGDANGMARIIDARAMASFLGGDVAGGETALSRAADLFRDSGDLVRVVTPRSTAGHALVFEGRPEEGLALVDEALGLARDLGHPESQTYALWHRAEALAALRRADEATDAAAEALAIATRIGHRGWTATAWRAIGLAAQRRGDLDAALHAFRSSLRTSEHLGLFASWAAARTAMVLVESGRAHSAEPLVARALAEGPPLGHYEARWARVEVAAATGDPATPGLAREAVALADAGGVRQGRDRLVVLGA
ncbi:BTAD domain-containing putative transcriptional regulator [Nocardioides taihuensis]|uniref:BTAD domain-containing putative transcriptional regulator n=1 Tax=Nocardioides taihuensis TaxID=1835606 RepID=A0ABW0BE90_9ACTN